MLTNEALRELGTFSPETSVVWCAECGHIYGEDHQIQGGTNCGATVSSGTPAECIEAMSRPAPDRMKE